MTNLIKDLYRRITNLAIRQDNFELRYIEDIKRLYETISELKKPVTKRKTRKINDD